jgi:class 3 adenylate cyclase
LARSYLAALAAARDARNGATPQHRLRAVRDATQALRHATETFLTYGSAVRAQKDSLLQGTACEMTTALTLLDEWEWGLAPLYALNTSAAVQAGPADAVAVLAVLGTLYDRALFVLHRGVDDLAAQWSDTVARGLVVHSVVVAVVCVCGGLGTVRLLSLILQQLRLEDEGTRMLLRMIPQSVQEAVPEVAMALKEDSDSERSKMQQSARLLENVLPPAISRRLKAGEPLIADAHANITAVMTDFKGWTEFVQGKSAMEIVDFLNELFTMFDNALDLYGVEKIKTIQQVYFCCTGLTAASAVDHELRAVEAVLHFFEIVSEYCTRRGVARDKLQLRAGINSGPVTAGVIGCRKTCYDLWGDTVNTASRIQSNGVPGRIQMSTTTHAACKDYFVLKERFISAKGKGKVPTYVVTGRNPAMVSPYYVAKKKKRA